MTKTNQLIVSLTSSALLIAGVSLAKAIYANNQVNCSPQEQGEVRSAENAVLGVLPKDWGNNIAQPLSMQEITSKIPTFSPRIIQCAIDNLMARHNIEKRQNDTFIQRITRNP